MNEEMGRVSEYSLGTTPILNKLKEMFSTDVPVYDTIFLNLGTILRNCSSNQSVVDAKKEDKLLGRKSKTPAHILIKEGKSEILRFMQDVCDILDSNKGVLFPSVVAYFVNYRKCIPESLYRPFTEAEREIALAEASLRGLVHGTKKDGKYSRVNFIELPIDSNQCPHRLLLKEFGNIKSNHHVIMISNHRLDYHIHKYCTKFCLIDSFTGNIILPRDLPQKVFGTNVIPFIPITHAILGDKDDIKPSIAGKEKKNLIKIATDNRWAAHSDEYIRIAIRNLKIPVPFEI